MVQGGGVSINRKKVDNLQMTVDSSLLLHEKILIDTKGKKELLPDQSCIITAFLLLCKKYIS